VGVGRDWQAQQPANVGRSLTPRLSGCALDARSDSIHVSQDPDRQPRRDRPARDPRLHRDGDRFGRRLLGGGPPRAARA
jgi:hypothetical protein